MDTRMHQRNSSPGAHAMGIPTADGYVLGAHVWRHRDAARDAPVVIINPATSVHSRYYRRFAEFLFRHGLDVVTYDYRGIGDSRPASLRGFEASWQIWGERDFEAVLQHVARAFPGRPVDVVAHSIGGFVTGLAPSAHRLRRVCTVGAQIAYWRDFDARARWRMWLRWQAAMPALTALCGYFPGRRLGWLEDTPQGVVHDWCHRMKRYEDAVRRGADPRGIEGRRALVERCSSLAAPLLAIGVDDDPFGTPAAIERLLGYFQRSRALHVRVSPGDVGEAAIGHFAFFHSRMEGSLWRLPLHWLQAGTLAPGVPCTTVAQPQAAREYPARPEVCL